MRERERKLSRCFVGVGVLDASGILNLIGFGAVSLMEWVWGAVSLIKWAGGSAFDPNLYKMSKLKSFVNIWLT